MKGKPVTTSCIYRIALTLTKFPFYPIIRTVKVLVLSVMVPCSITELYELHNKNQMI